MYIEREREKRDIERYHDVSCGVRLGRVVPCHATSCNVTATE